MIVDGVLMQRAEGCKLTHARDDGRPLTIDLQAVDRNQPHWLLNAKSMADELRAFVRVEVRLQRMTGHQADSLNRFADRVEHL